MNKIYFYIVFIVLVTISYSVLSYEKKSKIEQYLSGTTTQYTQNYNIVYNEYKKLSTVIFETKINTQNVKNIFYKTYDNKNKQQLDMIRKELFNELKTTYKLLKEYNLKQLHFHLHNNESFLRFHKPEKYGDNLTNIRATVKYVNGFEKQIDGFEEGRIYNGYRFVFPLFYDNIHIGSVEVSFSTIAMSTEIMKNFNVLSQFLILKSVVDKKVFKNEHSNYTPSQFEDFYVETKNIQILQQYNKNNFNMDVSNLTKEIVHKNALDTHSFSIYDNKSKSILTFIKIQNPISNKVNALLFIRSDSKYIENKTQNFYFLFGIFTLLIAIILVFIYNLLNQKDILNNLVDEKTKKLNDINRELEENEYELTLLNENLEYKIQEEVSKNRGKDKMLFEQTKMAALGEMIGNIAHQWRQPLSAISSLVSSMNLQKQLNTLDDNEFYKHCEKIEENAQYLSKTIDDFRNFIRGESKKEQFNLLNAIKSFKSLVYSSIKKHQINIHLNVDSSITILGLQNELNQCFINLFNNAKDALEHIDEEKHIFISAKTDKRNITIDFKDNAGGIDENILNKIFEPYFTTKHQSQGTGLGLHMTYRLIVDGMGGTISVTNDEFEYNGKSFKGARFIITIPS